jgi:Kef-type K+ transport system membrane component KefB
LVVGLLLLQDVIAIIVLLILNSGGGSDPMSSFVKSAIALPALGVFAWAGVRYVILPLLMKFDRFHEYIFLIAIGWCLGMAEAAKLSGLSAEMGAFMAGIALATSPISQYIATNLKPLRDFFLILFFFSVGASFNLNLMGLILVPSLILTLAVLLLKPVIFRLLLGRISESPSTGWEVGFRLGQISEFSLLIAYLAFSGGLIGTEASHVIQATAILSFLLSTYIVIFNYPSPIAVKDSLRKD